MSNPFSAATVILLCLAVLGAVADWVVAARGGGRTRWLTKGLGPAFLILAIALHSAEYPKPSWSATVLVFGLCLCLLGDYLLLDPGRFIPGLLAFAGAHVGFIAAFAVDEAWSIREVDRSLIPGRVVAIAVALIAISLPGRKILRGAARRHQLTLVLVYIVVITAMLFVAGMHTAAPYGWIAFVGAVAFFASDTVLGWRQFVRPGGRPAGELAVMIPYHVGLGLIGAWGLIA